MLHANLSTLEKKPSDFRHEVEKRRDKIRELSSKDPTSEVLQEMKELDNEVDELEKREVYWAQRSRQDWLRVGERNMAIFNQKAVQRRNRNNIKGVLDDGGVWRSKEEEAGFIFVEYFNTLFTSLGDNVAVQQVIDTIYTRVTPTMNAELGALYTKEEVVYALKQMHPTKCLAQTTCLLSFTKNSGMLLVKMC